MGKLNPQKSCTTRTHARTFGEIGENRGSRYQLLVECSLAKLQDMKIAACNVETDGKRDNRRPLGDVLLLGIRT